MNCLLCGGSEGRRLFEKQGHWIRRCAACGLVQLDPLPGAELEATLYGDRYFHGEGAGYADYAAQEAEYLATFAEDVQRIAGFVAGGALLDVGCGYGWFVREALAAGFDAHGVDVSAHAVEVAARSLGNRIHHGTPASAPGLSGRRFDAIFASHVIEHVTDPRSFVADLAGRLSERGVLVLVTPNVESWLARLSGRRWVSLKIPEHVAYYAPDTLRVLLEGAGLRLLALDPAYQHYRLPFVAGRVRELIRPLDRLVPPLERLPALRERMLRVTSGSLRAIAASPAPR